MLSYLFISSLLLFVFALGYFVFLRQSPALPLRRRVLLYGLVGILFLPLFPAPSLDWVVGEVPNPVAQIESWQQENALAQLPQPFDLTVEQGETMEEAIYQLAAERQPFWEDPFELAMVLYGLGVFFLLLRLGSGLFRLVRLHRRSTATGAGDIRILAEGGEAFTFGATVYLSQAVYDSPDAEVIITHERAHAAQWHTFDALLAEVMRALFWFHPMAWWLREQVQLNLEYLADAAVLVAGYDKRDYQLSLVAHQQGVDFRTSLLPQFAAKGLKRRIQMMGFRAGSQVRSWVVTAGLVLCASLVFVVSNGRAQSVSETFREQTTEISSPLKPGIVSPLINENTQSLDLFLKRIPTVEEMEIIRSYLAPFSQEDVFVYQDCTDQAAVHTLAIGQRTATSFTSVKGYLGVAFDEYLVIKRNKDGNGNLNTSMSRITALPDEAPDGDLALLIDGKWITVDIELKETGLRTYEMRKPLAAQLKCQLELTPENKEEYGFIMRHQLGFQADNYSHAKGYLTGAAIGIVVDSAEQITENAGAFFKDPSLLARYYIAEQQVPFESILQKVQQKAWNLTVAARKDGPADLVVVRLDLIN